MTSVIKPRVATVIVLGWALGPRFEGHVNVLWGQTRGYFAPNGQLLKGSPGERSIFGEHFKEGRDKSLQETAMACALQEFWPPLMQKARPLGLNHFELLTKEVETEKTINDVFLFTEPLSHNEIDIGEGDGLLRIPVKQVPLYCEHGFLTEASITCLKAVPPLSVLMAGLGLD